MKKKGPNDFQVYSHFGSWKCPKVLGDQTLSTLNVFYIIGKNSKSIKINWGHILKISTGVKNFVNLKGSK